MRTREEILAFALSFPDTYQDAPFHDDNWQLVRVKGSRKAFVWTYERNGYMNLNVKVDPEWRDYWRVSTWNLLHCLIDPLRRTVGNKPVTLCNHFPHRIVRHTSI